MSVQEEQQVSELAEKDKLAVDRLTALFDDGAFTEIDGYAKSASGDVEAAAGFGTVNGSPVYAFAQNVNVNGGAISVAQCAKLKKIYDLATKTGCPVIGIYDSNGVKLDEGFEALSAYGELVKASTAMSGVCTQISIIAGSCLGASALMANMADVVVAGTNALHLAGTVQHQEHTIDLVDVLFDRPHEARFDVIKGIFFDHARSTGIRHHRGDQFKTGLLKHIGHMQCLNAVITKKHLVIADLAFLRDVRIGLRDKFADQDFHCCFSFYCTVSTINPQPDRPLFSCAGAAKAAWLLAKTSPCSAPAEAY